MIGKLLMTSYRRTEACPILKQDLDSGPVYLSGLQGGRAREVDDNQYFR